MINVGTSKQRKDKMESTFWDEISVCIDSMLDEDAVGETMVFLRDGENLRVSAINAGDLKIENIDEYEMILFDGGNKFGDRWKHAFYPSQEKHFYVDENPLPSIH